MPRDSGSLYDSISQIHLYTTGWCGYCVRAKALLESLGLVYEEIRVDDEPGFRDRLLALTGGFTVPQVVIDGRPVGGYRELAALARDGRLDPAPG